MFHWLGLQLAVYFFGDHGGDDVGDDVGDVGGDASVGDVVDILYQWYDIARHLCRGEVELAWWQRLLLFFLVSYLYLCVVATIGDLFVRFLFGLGSEDDIQAMPMEIRFLTYLPRILGILFSIGLHIGLCVVAICLEDLESESPSAGCLDGKNWLAQQGLKLEYAEWVAPGDCFGSTKGTLSGAWPVCIGTSWWVVVFVALFLLVDAVRLLFAAVRIVWCFVRRFQSR